MNNLSEFQQILLQVYKKFAGFCEENGLTFYAAYGTMIGAVRHHGFIPWDDDIDVYMKRADYDKLIALRDKLDAPYKISCVLDGNSPYSFVKFYTTSCTIWEYKHFPFIIGPWIDVFPLDEGLEGQEDSDKAYSELHHLMWKYRKSLADVTWKQIGQDFIHLNGFNGFINLVKKCWYAPSKKKYLKQLEQCITNIKSIKSDGLRSYYNGLKRDAYPKELFENAIKLPFEDTYITVPNGYDQILTLLYKDYMQLPPEEKRVSYHDCFYINLKEVKTQEEILKEMEGKINEKAKPLSFKVILDEMKHRRSGF